MVSVIIPMYNREKTIEMAVRSVLEQTYQNMEIIIVDDCSTDRSVEIAKNIEDGRVRVIVSEKNGGACKARNIGIENAKGDIIALHDSDDSWHKDKLEKSLFYLEKTKADMVFSSMRRLQKGAKGYQEEITPSYNLNQEKDKMAKLLCMNCVATQSIVAKKQVFDTIRFDERLPRFQDWELALQIVSAGFNVFYIEEPLVDYYITEGSISSDSRRAVQGLEIIGKKYREYYDNDANAKESFYYRMASYIEKSGLNGAECFKQAYQVRKNKGMWFRYVLAKIRIYRGLCAFLDRLNGKQ